MLLARHAAANLEGMGVELLGIGVPALDLRDPRDVGKSRECIGILLTEQTAVEIERFLEKNLRLSIFAFIQVGIRQKSCQEYSCGVRLTEHPTGRMQRINGKLFRLPVFSLPLKKP